MDEIEKNDGQEIVRDTGTGRFSPGGTLSPERARELAQARQNKTARQVDAEVAQLLASKGYDDPDEAPGELRALARQIVSPKGNGLVPALKAWNDLTGPLPGQAKPAPQFKKPQAGETCPVCGQLGMPHVPANFAMFMVRLFQAYRERLKQYHPVVAAVNAAYLQGVKVSNIDQAEEIIREILGDHGDGHS